MQHRSTNLALIVLVLVAGVALGWLLRDLLRGGQPTADGQQPTALAAAPALAATSIPIAAPTTRPTEAPTMVPTRLPPTLEPTPTTEPTTEPTAGPTAEPTEAPTLSPEPRAAPTSLPTEAPAAANGEIAGYIGHVVGEGETLETIASAAGSAPDLIAAYNRLVGEPRPGHALIVPQLGGQQAALESVPLLVERGRTDEPWVALTLDAGAGAEPVASMLETLRERKITVTFFLTGKWITEHPDLTRQIVADGHELANHTTTHPDMRNISDTAIRDELAETEARLREAVGAEVSMRPFFRPPYGAYDKRVLQVVEGEGYLPIYWTLDSLDSVGEPKTPEFLLERVTAKLSPEQLRGAIILAHCGSAPTAEALPRILDRFAEMGFQVKKLSEVL